MEMNVVEWLLYFEKGKQKKSNTTNTSMVSLESSTTNSSIFVIDLLN